MTQNRNFKRRVRARASKTGESYTSALKHMLQSATERPMPQARSVRLAVAQVTFRNDPRDVAILKTGGAEMRSLMRQAKREGARLIHFPEGAICSPNKRIMSASGPKEVGPADWTRVEWTVLREELEETRRFARELGIWVIFGSLHQLSTPHRPYNSLYVISDRGELVTRYDERMLSHTKISFMYSPGRLPITFEVDGLRFGCALGMEAHYPEIFIEYEALDVDCTLFSTTGELSPNAASYAAEVLGHAATNTYWVSFSAHAQQGPIAPAGIAGPDGRWAALCANDETSSFAIATVTSSNPEHPARPWRRTARTGIYDSYRVTNDPRSERRDSF